MEPDESLRNLKDQTKLFGSPSLTQQIFESSHPRGIPEIAKEFSGGVHALLQNVKGIMADQDAERISAVQRITDNLRGPVDDARERLAHALDMSSAATFRLNTSLEHVPPIPDIYSYGDDTRRFTVPDLPPNPAHETNRQLADLKAQMAALVDVAREQAKMTQAINESTQAALHLASQSSEEAKASSELARTSIELARTSIAVSQRGVAFAKWALVVTVFSTMLSAFISLYIDNRNRASHRPSPATETAASKKQAVEKAPPKPKP